MFFVCNYFCVNVFLYCYLREAYRYLSVASLSSAIRIIFSTKGL